MNARKVVAALAVLALAPSLAACAGRDFRALFGDREAAFNCEVQKVHAQSAVKVRDIPPEAGPAGMMMGLEPGTETVAWLYHFEDDGADFRDDEAAYTIAVVLRKAEAGHYALPSDQAAVVFFCDNWGRGLRAAEARATGGWVTIGEVTAGGIRGELSVSMSGFAQRPDRSREGIKVNLEGRFHAVR